MCPSLGVVLRSFIRVPFHIMLETHDPNDSIQGLKAPVLQGVRDSRLPGPPGTFLENWAYEQLVECMSAAVFNSA